MFYLKKISPFLPPVDPCLWPAVLSWWRVATTGRAAPSDARSSAAGPSAGDEYPVHQGRPSIPFPHRPFPLREIELLKLLCKLILFGSDPILSTHMSYIIYPLPSDGARPLVRSRIPGWRPQGQGTVGCHHNHPLEH